VLRLLSCFILLVLPLAASDIWSGPSFSADAAALRQAADAIKAGKHDPVTVLLNDISLSFDASGKVVQTNHLIYRIENEEGVQDWAEVSGQWEAWHQSKPEIKARVIANDATVHWIDSKTMNDVPVHADVPETYTDDRRYGGPLPGIAVGAIVEQEVIVRDTAPLFAAGIVYRWGLGWSVPIHKTHYVISHAQSLPLHYQVHLLPEASVSKSAENGVESVTLDQGPLPAYQEQPDYVPSDVVLRPEIEFSTGTSWEQVASEYARSTNEKFRAADVQPLLVKLSKTGSRTEIIRRIVATLHKNIRYTGVEFGESSLIPQFPSETLKRKYGDCKDKATLLIAMLRAAGIPANLALLDAGPGRDVNPELPGIGVFDHAIVYVPAAGSDPELWIDATAQYSQVGTLPWMDYSRSALIIADGTNALKKTPDLTPEQNLHRELRVFTLPEYGHASIAEINDEVGPEEADYRQYYSGDSKEARKSGEEYVKDMYLADSLTSLDHDDLTNLEKPAAIKFVTKGRRGNTDLSNAVVAIRTESLFDRLPKYFRTPEETQKRSSDDGAQAGDEDKPKPRTVDWRINPFATEWRYEITAPVGFKLRALPSNKHDKVDILTFSQEYSANSDGTVVKAVLRVECSTSRMTAQQAKDLRDAVVKARNADPVYITFDNIGQSLIAAGKIKEGLAAYRQIASQHPKEALHKVQLARALLTAGLGEQARVEAQAATALEPTSALAFSTLGSVLKHDQIGRLLKKGMDFQGSIAAYKKAIALDPTEKANLADLGLLLEYDADGVRYAEDAPLKDAVATIRELKKLDEEYARSYEDNILYDLWYAHDYQGVLDYAAALPTSDVRKGLTVAAIALTSGTDAALKKSVELTTDDANRSQVLMNAGAALLRVRKYPETAAFFNEAARGQSNASQVTRSAAMFANTRLFTEMKMDPNDPRSVVYQLFGEMCSGRVTMQEFKSLIYIDPLDDDDFDQKKFDQMMTTFRSQVEATGLPLPVLADLTVSNMKFTVDGDDALGYKIIVEAAGAPAQDIYVIKHAGQFKIVAFSSTQDSSPERLSYLALAELQKNNLVAARKWLDRARDRIHMGGGDDPLDGNPFPHFWTKGQEGDASAIRLAALVLMPSKQLKTTNIAAVIAARDAAKSDIERARLNMVLAHAYSAQEAWSETLPVALDLMKALPNSLRAFDIVSGAYTGLKRFDEWDKLVQARRAEHPDELEYIRAAARIAAYRAQFDKAREIIKTIMDKGQSNSSDLNLYAWFALALPGPIDQEAIDTGMRATDLAKNSFAIQHTLGCVYAQAGKTSQARELLLKAMDANHLAEPNSEIWFGFGLIAEQYGAADAAQKMFARVEKPKGEYPASSYALAQQHLANLKNAAKLTASS
jgi:tetratricopeptide (TPR) repeat protein